MLPLLLPLLLLSPLLLVCFGCSVVLVVDSNLSSTKKSGRRKTINLIAISAKWQHEGGARECVGWGEGPKIDAWCRWGEGYSAAKKTTI